MNHTIKIFLGIVVMALMVLYFQQSFFRIKFKAFKQPRVITTSVQKRERTPSISIPGQFSLYNIKIQTLPFISSLKNPCWFEQRKGSGYTLNCLPYFFIVGQPKSATTDLHWQLVKHPDISRGNKKEPHWWDRRRLTTRGTWKSYVTNFIISSYLQNECGLNEPSKASNISATCKRRITLEASPSTFWNMGKTMREFKKLEKRRHSPKVRQLLQLLESSQLKTRSVNDYHGDPGYFRYTLADLIHLQLPDSRIIVILRNPVDRLYSGYRFFKRYEQKSPVKFDNEVRWSLKIWNSCLKRNSHRFCIYDPITTRSMDTLGDILCDSTLQLYFKLWVNKEGRILFYMFGVICKTNTRSKAAHLTKKLIKKVRLYVSIYITFVEDWLKAFPRNQILFIRTEDYKDYETETMSQVCEHLGLDPFPANSQKKGRRLGNVTKIKLGPMLNETRNLLTNFFAPFNRQLAEILKDDKFLWKDSLN